MPFARQSSSLSAPTPSTETSPSALMPAEVDMTKEYDVWEQVPKSMLLNMIMNP